MSASEAETGNPRRGPDYWAKWAFVRLGVLPFLVVLALIAFTAMSDNFLSVRNLTNVVRQSEATSATVVNDRTIAVVVPAGAGTVDVRVQFGVNAPGNYQVRVDLARGVQLESDANYSNDST